MAVRPERYTDVMMLGSERTEHEQAIEEKLGEGDGEGAEVRIAKKPRLPTELEVEQHYAAGHVPYRSWCPICVKGQGVNTRHACIKREEQQEYSTVSIDYAFMTSDGDAEDEDQLGMPILVMHDRQSGKVNSNVVPSKGVNPYAVIKCVQNIKLLGYYRLHLKSDQEPAIVALREAVKAALADEKIEVMPEESPLGESQANGEVENSVRMIKAQVRKLRLSLESRYKVKLREDHPIIPWLVAEAAEAINRFQIGLDGKSRRERESYRKEMA